jgi:inner membrane protein YidH
MQNRSETAFRDRLARKRTELANERTLLAYVRTALGFLAVGIPAVWWFEDVLVQRLGVLSLILAALLVGIGIHRFIAVKAAIDEQGTTET